MERPLEGDATVNILKFDHDLAKQVYWHSSAHIVGEACERFCGCHLCYGPPIAEGFYYDMYKEVIIVILLLKFNYFLIGLHCCSR